MFLRWGQNAFEDFRVVPPGTGIFHQVNLEYLGKTVFVAEQRRRVSGHARRDRFPHHDDQRARRARLGRGRHRGRGGDARPAGVHARSPKWSASGSPASCPVRRRPTSCSPSPRCSASTTWSAVRRVLGPGVPACRSPTARRSNMARSTARRARFFPIDAETLATWRSPAARGSRSSWSRRTRGSRVCGTDSDTEDPTFTETLELDLGDVVEPRSRVRSARRTAWR